MENLPKLEKNRLTSDFSLGRHGGLGGAYIKKREWLEISEIYRD